MNLSDAQLKAVHSDQPLILAPAAPGAGKTRVLVERIKRLVGDQIVNNDALNPTQKPQFLTGVPPKQIVAITFTNSAANEITKRLGFSIGYAGTLHGFVLRLLQEFGSHVGFSGKITVLDETANDQILEQIIKENSYKGTKEALISAIAEYPFTAASSKPQLTAYAYHRKLLSGNMVTFDTILIHGRQLIPLIQTQLVGRWTHLLVDEYQDATGPDVHIYDPLPIPNKFYTGDENQSVYSFRGGSIDHIQRLASYPGTTVLPLETNYRSDIRICQSAQKLIEHNPNRIGTQIVPHSTEQGEITVRRCKDSLEEIHSIFKTITGGLDPQECAVLLRSNALVDKYAEALKALGLPVACKKHTSWPKDWPACMLLLSVLSNPDNDTLMGLWIKKHMPEPLAVTIELRASEQYCSINQALTEPYPHNMDPRHIAGFIARRGISQESVRRLHDIASKLEFVPHGNGVSSPPTLHDLLLAIGEEQRVEHEIGTGVTVTTYHAAKGREWGTVFLPCFEQSVLPSAAKSADIEEDRRIAYVGVTRAEHRLFISSVQHREPDFGWTLEKREPSQFISEMGL